MDRKYTAILIFHCFLCLAWSLPTPQESPSGVAKTLATTNNPGSITTKTLETDITTTLENDSSDIGNVNNNNASSSTAGTTSGKFTTERPTRPSKVEVTQMPPLVHSMKETISAGNTTHSAPTTTAAPSGSFRSFASSGLLVVCLSYVVFVSKF